MFQFLSYFILSCTQDKNRRFLSYWYNVIDNQSVAVAKSGGDPYQGSVEIPAAITYQAREYAVTKIASYAFAEGSESNSAHLLTSVTMGNNITAIEEAAFQDCRALRSAKVSNRTLYLGVNAFANCTDLTSVTLGRYLEEIRDGAFQNCLSLGQIELYDGLKSLGLGAFFNCHTLTSINIPNSVQSLGNQCFESCSNLSSVTFGSGVESIGEAAFKNCTTLKSIKLPELVTAISPSTFYGCSVLSDIKFGSSVTTISDNAFNGCKALETFTVPASVNEIGEDSFGACDGLKFLTFSDSATPLRYGSGNFTSSPVERLTLGRTLQYTSNNPGAFSEIDRQVCNLKRVEITSTVNSLPKAIFKGCKALNIVNIAEGLQEIGQNAFESCEGLTVMQLPQSVTRILANSFAKCFNMTGFDIPSNVSVIETQAFYMCRNITAVDLSNVAEIKAGAFSECDRVADVKLGSRLSTIASEAFNTCLALRSITIPESVKTLGSGAFFESGLTEINSLAVVPPTAKDDTWSREIYRDASVTVPAESYDAYRAAEGWSNFANFDQVITYTATLDANQGGKVLLNGAEVSSVNIPENGSLVITLKPDAGKVVESASYTMGSATKSFTESISISPVTADVAIKVTFGDKPLTPPTSIRFLASSYTIRPQESVELAIEYLPDGAYSPVTYSIVSGADVVSLEGSTVTGLKNGSAKILAATANGLTATCSVTVNDGSVYIEDINASELAVYEPYRCKVIGAGDIDAALIKWSSSDESVAKFFDGGVMMVVNDSGNWVETTITATLPSGQSVSYDLAFFANGSLYRFNYMGYGYLASAPFNLIFTNNNKELSADVIVPETIDFEGYTYTITGVAIETFNGSKNVALTIPATVTDVEIESNFIDKITCFATVPPKGSLSLYHDNENIIYVPAESVSAYQAARPWSSYTVKAIGDVSKFYNVTVNANEGGFVQLNGNEATALSIEEGKSLLICAVPDYGKRVKSASYTMGSVSRSFDIETEIDAVSADVTIDVVFENEKEPDPQPGENAIANFYFNDPTSLTPAQTVSSNNSPVCEVSGVTFTNKSVSVVTTGGSTTARIWAYRDSYQYRVYNGATTTISTTDGVSDIVAVVITGSQLDALKVNGAALDDAQSVSWVPAPGTKQINISCVTNGSHKRADISTISVEYSSTAGIEDIIADDSADVKVYNLQGVKVSDSLDGLQPGIYIVSRGGSVSKIAIK